MSEFVNQINWYPGHMAKARRQMEEQLKLVDIVIELRDARIPLASANPILKELSKNKPSLIILNKADLADEEKSLAWKNEGVFSVKGVAGAAAFADAVNSTLANRQLIAQQERAALPVYPKKPAIDAETLRSLKSQLETGAITREQYDAALRSYQTKDWNEHE